MSRIESDKLKIDASPSAIYDFLKDFRNYEELMPPMVSNYTAEEGQADFDISGFGKVHVDLGDVIENKFISILPKGNLPVQFDLAWEIEEADGGSLVTAVANAKLNMFMRMMAEPKLKEFVQIQAETLKEHFGKS